MSETDSKPDYNNLPDDALLRLRQLGQVVPFATATVWRRVKANKFPAPIRLEGRITAWRWGDVRAWLKEQAASPQPVSKTAA